MSFWMDLIAAYTPRRQWVNRPYREPEPFIACYQGPIGPLLLPRSTTHVEMEAVFAAHREADRAREVRRRYRQSHGPWNVQNEYCLTCGLTVLAIEADRVVCQAVSAALKRESA